MSVETAVELSALALAIGAAWLSLRKPAELEWERLWKVLLATVIRGEVEANGGDQAQWWSRLAAVPFHPAGRAAASKLNAPDLDQIPVPALDGERALVERLSALESVEERWNLMFRTDAAVQEELLSDPDELGPAYDPSTVLAPGAGWRQVANWDATVQSAIARRMADTVLVVVGRPAEPFERAVPHGSVLTMDAVSDDALLAAVPESQQRLVVVVEGPLTADVLRVLHGSPSLRDRVLTVVALAPEFDEEWMAGHFLHDPFDTELNRQTPYVSITNAHPTDASIADQRFPVPPELPSGWAPIAPIDLGLLPLTDHDPDLLARALWVLVCFCISRH